MSKAKRAVLISAAAVLALAAVLYASGTRVEIWFGDREYSSHIALACDPPTGYEQGEGVGYLTIPYKNFDGFLTLKVEDETAQKELAGADMSEIIGVRFEVCVPGSVLDEMGIDPKSYDGFRYIGSERANGPDAKLILEEVFY